MARPPGDDLPQPGSPRLAEDAVLLERAVRAAGDIAMRFYGNKPKTWDKGDDHPVSEADIAIDQHLRAALHETRPGYGWLSEESVDDKTRLDRRAVWIVDPIDGTRAFLDVRKHFSVSVALVLDGTPVLAAVHAPAAEGYFAAAAGAGATCNGRPIRVSARKDFAQSRILTTRSTFRALQHRLDMPGADWVYRNSIAYRLALAASGRFDASVTLTEKSEWDVVAGDLLVREAGGRVTDLEGAEQAYNQPLPTLSHMIAAPPQLHERLRQAAAEEVRRYRLENEEG